MAQPPYAWPSSDVTQEKTAAVIAEVLAKSFNKSRTKIKNEAAIMSAARHIAGASRIDVALAEHPWPEPPGTRTLSGEIPLSYAIPSYDVRQENNAAVLYQIIRASFNQSATKVKDDEAILSAARHVAQSGRLAVSLPGLAVPETPKQETPAPVPAKNLLNL